jgi:hypothetical protein
LATSPDLRQSCIALLAEVIAEDCRYQVLSPRLHAPPNALQAICLNLALALLEADPLPATLASVGFAVLPAFDTFEPCLYPRLLEFYGNGILRPMLTQLSIARGNFSIASFTAG